MFISDELAFIHLQKTAGVHIAQLLGKVVSGERIPDHLSLPAEYRSRFIIGSMRNPWDWYVSLWAYGCGRKGSVYANVTKPLSVSHRDGVLPRDMGVSKLSIPRRIRQQLAERSKPIESWQGCYRDHEDVEGFRQWIKLMFDPRRRFDLREGYGFSPISSRFGLLTYRHFRLQSLLEDRIYRDNALSTLDGLNYASEQYRLVDFIIRNESLEQDLMSALKKAGVELSNNHVSIIEKAKLNPKNKSSRMSVGEYYDDQTREMVAAREEFLIKEFQYSFPG